jgi:hypothetical protein
MAMARDGLLPQYFARIHPRFRTPHITTIWTGVIVGGIAMVTDIGSLSDLTNIGTLFAFILVCLGVLVLRRTDRNRPRPFRVPFVPLFPILGVLFCAALMLSLPIETWVRFIGWLIIGLAIYFLYSIRHSRLQHGIAIRVIVRHGQRIRNTLEIAAPADASGAMSCSRFLIRCSAARRAERGPKPGRRARSWIRRSISGPAVDLAMIESVVSSSCLALCRASTPCSGR